MAPKRKVIFLNMVRTLLNLIKIFCQFQSEGAREGRRSGTVMRCFFTSCVNQLQPQRSAAKQMECVCQMHIYSVSIPITLHREHPLLQRVLLNFINNKSRTFWCLLCRKVQKTSVPPFVLLLLMHKDLLKWSKRRYEENIKRHYPADWYSRPLKEARINVVCAATSPLIIADWRFVFHYVIRDDQYRSITLLPPLIPSFHRLYNVSIHYLMAYWWLEYSTSGVWTPEIGICFDRKGLSSLHHWLSSPFLAAPLIMHITEETGNSRS